MMNQHGSQSLVEASIDDLQTALSTFSITSVELVSKLLHRISTYDCRGVALNSIPIINPNVFTEAAASDQRRARGKIIGPLDGIPYTVKDSYMVKGMTVACGSVAFQDLMSGEDAFVVGRLREAGAVLIGKTNMPPMADSGLQGVYGRAESPYNLEYLAAGFASGSSVGSAVATAASFATFGLGGETVSSGRSPASNNGLVAYTPSRGGISIRGDWPLYPTCDVVVPHTRTMDDLFILLDTITARDDVTHGDFWRDQPFFTIQDPWKGQPRSLCELSKSASLEGLHIAVPEMYIGGGQASDGVPIYTSPSVKMLWQQAKTDLERLGAQVTFVSSFPLVEQYEILNDPSSDQSSNMPRLPKDWQTTERSTLIAHVWESFLKTNEDPKITSLSHVWHGDLYPSLPPDDPQVCFSGSGGKIHYDQIATYAELNHNAGHDIYDVPQFAEALAALDTTRKMCFEDWLFANQFDCVVFPAAGDVGAADADVNYISAEHAWKNGVKYSNGGRALRHLGIPSITVPMGLMEDKDMPIGLTFCGRAGSDLDLLQWGKAYESGTKRRRAPKLVPALSTDELSMGKQDLGVRRSPPALVIEECVFVHDPKSTADMLEIKIDGHITIEVEAHDTIDLIEPILEIFVDAVPMSRKSVHLKQEERTAAVGIVYSFYCQAFIPAPPQRADRRRVVSKKKIARDSTMVVILAKNGLNGRPSGFLKLL